MNSKFFPALFVLCLYLLIPLYFAFTQSAWTPADLTIASFFLFSITQLATFPYALLTCFILLIVFGFLWRVKNKADWIKLALLLGFAIILGQGIKEVVKSTTKEPRPYVTWLMQAPITQDETLSVNYFYQLNKPERQQFIAQNVSQRFDVPTWLSAHWQKETSYSFPSGHVLFATSWAFLALFLLGFKAHSFTVSLLVLFGALMEISRLQLGMHHPIDVMASALLSFLIALLILFLMRKLPFLRSLLFNLERKS